MRLIAGGVASLFGPLAAGWLILDALWPESPRILRFALAIIVGMGLAGAAYLAALSLTDSAGIAFICSEAILAIVIVALFVFQRSRVSRIQSPAAFQPSFDRVDWVMLTALALVLIVASGAFFFVADYSGQGGWDAIALWNAKARFIFRSTAEPLNLIVDRAAEHPDYPLLLPSMVARDWQYVGKDTRFVSLAIAAMFTIMTFLIMVGGIRRVSGASQAWLAGCVLLGTPFFLQHGASQYADIVLCCFITATIVIFCIHDSIQSSWTLPVLAGLMAGFAACTKNEGLLFVLIVTGSRVLLSLWRKSGMNGAIEIGAFGAGASAGLVALALFKFLHSPPNQIVGNVTMHVISERIQSMHYHVTIWRGFAREFHNFGNWWLYPVPLLLIHFAVSRSMTTRRRGTGIWQMPLLVLLGMLTGYYAVYLFAPEDLEWHIASSLSRILLQIWPTALVLYSVATTPLETPPAQNPKSAKVP